jgi:hypothetical protein
MVGTNPASGGVRESAGQTSEPSCTKCCPASEHSRGDGRRHHEPILRAESPALTETNRGIFIASVRFASTALTRLSWAPNMEAHRVSFFR